MYYLHVYQPKDFPIVEVRIRQKTDPYSGYIGAQKAIDFHTNRLGPAAVSTDIIFRNLVTPEQAREIAEWWKVAAATAEMLDKMILTREDLGRPIEARLEGKMIKLAFVQAESA